MPLFEATDVGEAATQGFLAAANRYTERRQNQWGHDLPAQHLFFFWGEPPLILASWAHCLLTNLPGLTLTPIVCLPSNRKSEPLKPKSIQVTTSLMPLLLVAMVLRTKPQTLSWSTGLYVIG